MALQFQNIPVVFQGLNRKVDDRQGITGQLTTMQNAWMDKTGRIQKRYGYSQTELDDDDNFYSFDSVTALAEWRGSLIAFSGSLSNVTDVNFYVSKRADIPDRRGSYWPARLEFYRALSNVTNFVYYYSESNTYKYLTTGSITQFTKEMAILREYSYTDLGISGGSAYITFGFDNGIYFFVPYQAPSTTKIYKLTETAGELSLDTEYTPTLSVQNNVWDAVLRNEGGVDYIYIIYQKFGVGATIAKHNIAAGTTIEYLISGLTASKYALDVHSGCVFFGYVSTGTFVSGGVLNATDLSVKTAATFLYSADGTSVDRLAASGTVFADGTAAASVWSTDDNGLTECARQDRTLTIPGIKNSEIVTRGFSSGGLGTKKTSADTYGENIGLCWVRVAPDDNDATNNVFICIDAGRDDDLNYPKTYAHCLNGRTRGFDDFTRPFSEKFLFPVSEITDGIIVADVSDNLDSTNFEYSRLLMANAGPNVAFYDGKYFSNAGFAYYPSIEFDSYIGGGALTGTYYYRVVAAYKDKQGNIHRSAPSLPVTTTPVSQNVSLSIPAYFGFFAGEETIIEIYRSEDGSIYQLYDNVAATPITGYTDNGGGTLGANLYTTGGILEHIAPPAARTAWASKDRIWIISAEDPIQVYFSKRIVPFEGPNFTDAFVLQVEDQGGELFAGASLDDKSVLFKKTAIYVIFGEGPDETGSGEYSIQQISYDTGTTNPRSVLETNQGVYFASQKGIYLLTKDLQTQFIGAPVDDYDESLITQAIVLEDRNQVWFFRSNGETLVFDTYHGQWCTYTNQAASSATIANGVVRYVIPGTTSASFYAEDTASFQDGTTDFDVVLTSNWLQLAGVQGYQRTRLITLAGKVTGAYDYSLALTYDLGDAEATETFSDSDTTENKHEFKPKVQKTEAFKFTLTLSGSNRGFDLVNFNLNVGNKGGSTRLPTANRTEGT